MKTLFTTILTSFVLAVASCNGSPAKHVHTFSSDWSYDETFHWHAATCGHDVKEDYEIHTWGEWVIDRPASATQEGLKHKTCEVCSLTSYESIQYQTVDATRVFIYVYEPNACVGVGSTKTLNPVVFPNNAKKDIHYIVDDPEILTVDDTTGVLTGRSQGSALITIYNDNNANGEMDSNEPRAFASYNVLEKNPNYSVTIDQQSYQISVGEEITVNPTPHGFSLASYQNWGSYAYDSPYVSTSYNKIKGIKPGVADIVLYVTPEGESISYDTTIQVTVVDKVDEYGLRANSIEFEDSTRILTLNDVYTPNYTIYPSDSIDTNVVLTSNNDVLTINGRSVTANKAGTSVLTIKTPNNKFSRMRVTVVNETANYEDAYKGYYGDLSWTDGADLRNKLHDIISSNFIPLKYTNNWESNINADYIPGNEEYVSVLYRDNPILASNHGTNSGQWQREHCFAASLLTGIGTGPSTTKRGRGTDFHNLYAAFGQGNGSRNNKNFGYADVESLRYAVANNGGNYCADDTFFEPNDVDKGILARAVFYMATMYNTEEEFTTSEGITFNAQPLQITDDKKYTSDYKTLSYSEFTNTDKPQLVTLEQNYENIVKELYPEVTDETEIKKKAYSYFMTTSNTSAIGNLNDLLMWNSYSVNEHEMQHNNSVYAQITPFGGGSQGNRNPYIDYPELVEYAFGSLQHESGSLSELRPSVLDLPGIEIPDNPKYRDKTDDVSASDCNYNFEFSSSPQNLVNTTTKQCTFGALTWTYAAQNDSVGFSSSRGLKIGTSSVTAGEISFETNASLEDVEAVVLYAYCPAEYAFTYDIYVGDEKVKNDVYLTQEVSALTYYGNLLSEKKSGKVKFVLKYLTNYISLKGIAIKYKA